jgi:hypothetical protein
LSSQNSPDFLAFSHKFTQFLQDERCFPSFFFFYAAAQCLTEETENGLFEASHAPDGCAEGQGLSPIRKAAFSPGHL